MKQNCPVCGKAVKASTLNSQQTKFSPFCSLRCKLIDLGRWLDAEYKITSELPPEENDQTPQSSSDTDIDNQ